MPHRYYHLYTVRVPRGGFPQHSLRLGVFDSADEAREVAEYVRPKFLGVGVVPVSHREYSRAIELARQAKVASKIYVLESALGGLGGLVLLSEKRLTYADLYDITKGRDRRMQAVTANAAGRVSADGRIKLACTLKAKNPIGGEVFDFGEVQYFIDPAANSISASAWEPPTDIRISDTLISFRQGIRAASISRATGGIQQITQPASGGAFMANGTCQPIGAPKFKRLRRRAASNLSASAAAHCARCCTGARNSGSLIFSALSRSRSASARHALVAVSSSSRRGRDDVSRVAR